MLLSVTLVLKKNLKDSQLKLHYLRATAISILFGAGWAIGISKPMTEDITRVILDLLFLMTVGVLGVVVFTTFCVASKVVRNVWRACLCSSEKEQFPDKKNDFPKVIEKPQELQKPTLEFREFSLDLDAGSLRHEEVMVIDNQFATEDLSAATLSDIPPVVLDQSADIDPPDPDEETQL